MKRYRACGLSIGMALSVIACLSCGWGKSDTSSASNASSSSSSTSTSTSRISLGYYTEYNGINYSLLSIESFATYINAVSTSVFSVDATGAIIGSVTNTQVLGFDKGNGVRTYACVKNYANGSFQSTLAHSAIVTNESAVINNLLALLQSGDFDGVNIDFENVYPQDRLAYSQFVHDLTTSLHASGFKLVLSVPAKQADDPTNTWSGAFNFKAIGQDADLLQMMTYDENAPGRGNPGPVSGSDWVERCIKYAVTVVAPSKLLIGLPAYGYDWKQLTDGTWVAGNSNYNGSFTWTNNPTQPANWGGTSNSPYVDYTDASGLKHEAWFENTQSIQIKTALVKKYNLAGFSMWSLGNEDLSFWQATAAGLQ